MARLFPLRSETQTSEGQPRVVNLEGEDADAVFGALSSTTARRIYGHVAEKPATPSDVAEAVDTSIQNVRYHLEKLEEAGLIEVVDTWYSSRGNEMSVYAASDGPLVVATDRSRAEKLRDALSRYLGGLAVLAGASLFVQYGVERLVSAIDSVGSGFAGEDAGPEDAPAGGGDSGVEEESADAADTDAGDEEEAVADDADEGDDAAETEAAGDEDAVEEEGADDVGGANESSDVDDADAPNESDPPDAEPSDTPMPEETPTPETPTEPVGTETPVDHAPEAADALLGTLPPGLVFFLGGLCVLTLVTVWWYRTPY